MQPKTPRQVQLISIDSLQLDVENFRIGHQESQRDAILSLVSDQGKKLSNLAKDLLELGLSPLESFAVMPIAPGAKTYLMLEGNRRLVALKLVRSPELVEGLDVYAAFKKLNKKYINALPSALPCVVMVDRAAARPWIERKHDRGMEGAGVEQWGAEAKSRFQESAGIKDPTLVLLDAVRAQRALTEAQKKALESVPFSTLERILTDSYVQTKLGLRLTKGLVTSDYAEAAVLKTLTQIALDLTGKMNVNDVRTKKQRKDYIDSLPSKIIPKEKDRVDQWNFGERFQRPDDHGRPAAKPLGRGQVLPPSSRRKTVAPNRGLRLNVTDQKAANILGELRALKAEEFPMAGALLLRTFLEVSCISYQRAKGLPWQGAELSARIEAVAKHLEDQKMATKNELKGARKAASSQHDIASTNTLNAYVHNPQFVPRPSDLYATWDQLHPFFEKIWG